MAEKTVSVKFKLQQREAELLEEFLSGALERMSLDALAMGMTKLYQALVAAMPDNARSVTVTKQKGGPA